MFTILIIGLFLEKNAVDLLLMPHKRRLNFDSVPDEELKETKQPPAKRKRKLIQKAHIKVMYNYLVHSLAIIWKTCRISQLYYVCMHT